MPSKISVIIPIYNVASCLERGLDSICTNSFRDLELICINDGSSDDSLAILREYARREPRIRIVDQPNGGVSAARNAGLAIASGEYVSFVDPDDLLHPRFFERLLSVAERMQAECVVCYPFRVDEEELPISMESAFPKNTQFKMISMDGFFQNHQCRTYCWGRIIKAEFAKAIRFNPKIHIGEDGAYMSALWAAFPKLRAVVLNESLYYYVQRSGSAMDRSDEKDLLALAQIYETKMTGDAVTDRIYLLQTIRRGLTVRYLCTHIHPDRTLARECRRLLRRCAVRLRRTEAVTTKQKLLHQMLIWCPGLYWLYRVRQPGMLRWELVERKKRREQRRQHPVEPERSRK